MSSPGRWAAFALVAAALRCAGAESGGGAIVVEADARAAVRPLAHVWSESIGGGQASEGLRATWLEQLRTVADECGFHYVRLRGLCADEMVVARVENGRPVYSFAYVDDLLDRVLNCHVRPILVLGHPPPELKSRLLRHCEDRYGVPEVRSWRIEVERIAPDALSDADRGQGPKRMGAMRSTFQFSHDGLPAAALIVRSSLERSGAADAPDDWTFSDAAGEDRPGDGLFHGGPGLINYQGIVKPAFHAYRCLHALGDEELEQVPGGIVTRRRSSGRVVALAYNASASARPLSVVLTGLRPGGQVLLETLDRTHGNATQAWEDMNRPAEPGRAALDTLRSAARAVNIEYRQCDDVGHFALERNLEPWSLLLLRQL